MYVYMYIYTYSSVCCANLLQLQLCLTLCDAMDYSPPGSSVHGFSRLEHWSGCRALLQGLFCTQGLNPCILQLLHWQEGSSLLTPPGKPLIQYSLCERRGQTPRSWIKEHSYAKCECVVAAVCC